MASLEINKTIAANKAKIRQLAAENAELLQKLRQALDMDAMQQLASDAETLARQWGHTIEQLRERSNYAEISCARNNVMAQLCLKHGYSADDVADLLHRDRSVVNKARSQAMCYKDNIIPIAKNRPPLPKP